MTTKQKQVDKARRLLSTINHQMDMMQCIIHTGFMMDNDTFRMMLRNNPHIDARWNQLQSRKFKLQRFLWRTA